MGSPTENKGVTRCNFTLVGKGGCGVYTLPGKAFCDKHYALRCAVCNKRQARFACEEPTEFGEYCDLPICSSICLEVHVPKSHSKPVNYENVTIHVSFQDGVTERYSLPSSRLGEEIALIHPRTKQPCRLMYASTTSGMLCYAEVGDRRPPAAMQPHPPPLVQAPAVPMQPTAVQPPPPTQAPPRQESDKSQRKHGTNLLTAFSLHVGYLLSICEQNNPFVHEVLVAQSPDLRDRLEKILTDVTIAILKERDG